MLFQDRDRAESFGADADQYDRSRPTYPQAMVDRILDGRRPPIDVLDVGCGTGISSRLFRDAGCSVLGVEVDQRMAEVARQSGLEVEVSPFESWGDRGRRFDLVISGQAWHWVDPVAGAVKAADVLRPGGRLAVFWNIANPGPEIAAALDDIYARLAPGIDDYSVLLGRGGYERPREADRVGAAAQGVESSSRFGPVEHWSFPWERHYTTAAWVDQLPTHSDHRNLDPAVLEPLLTEVTRYLDDHGGGFVMRYEAMVVTAQPRATSTFGPLRQREMRS